MSRSTKRKHVIKEVLDDFSVPEPHQQIVQVLESRGNNLHQVLAADQTTFLVSMPTKFRRNIWVKRGNFILVEPIEEGDKVRAEMVRLLTPEHVKLLKKDGLWPTQFDKNNTTNDVVNDLFINTNRTFDNNEIDETSDSD